MNWKEFKAMGTEVVIMADLTTGQEQLLTGAEQEVLDFEKKFSRFLVDSELSKFNNSKDVEQELSETMIELLTLSKYYYSKTNGIFDPTIISNLEGVGYDKNFNEVTTGSSDINVNKLKEEFVIRPKIDELKIAGRIVSCHPSLRIDLGGIGKGYIVDLLSKKFFYNIPNYWISAGGDILVAGCQENGDNWEVKVQNPLQPETDSFIINTKKEKLGIATSGVIKRRGQSGNFVWHHIIDTRTGLPVVNNVLSVTVISSDAVKADVLAKTILILGEVDGLKFIEQETDSSAIIFIKDKEPIISSRANTFTKRI